MIDYNGIRLYWTGHDGYRIDGTDINNNKKTVYIDPFQLSEKQKNRNDADILLISHNHFDHLSMDDLKHIINKETSIVVAQECVEQLKEMDVKELKGTKPGDKLTIQNMLIEIIPAYNTNKKFHPKTDEKVGFAFTLNDQRIYHTGDTDVIPEMKNISPDIALVPVSGTYVMTAEEAAQAVNEIIKPKKLAIPMHYGTIVGTEQDAEKFKDLVKVCDVKILQKE